MEFVIEALDQYLNPIGRGPIRSATSVSVSQSLDEVDKIDAEIPATDDLALELLELGRRWRFRTSTEDVFYGIIRNDDLTAGNRSRSVSGPGLADELIGRTCGMWSTYFNESINNVVLPDLVRNTGWSWAAVDGNLGVWAGNFDNLTRLQGIQRVRERTGRHVRTGLTPRTLELGLFGVTGGVRLTNVTHFLRAADNTNVAIIGDLTIARSGDDQVNRVFPWGKGNDNGDTNRQKVMLADMDPADTVRLARMRVAPGLRGPVTTVTTGSSGSTINVVSTAGFRPISGPTQQLFIGNPNDLTGGYLYNIVVNTVNSPTQLDLADSGYPYGYTTPNEGDVVVGDPQYYIQDDAAYADNSRERVVIFPDVDVVGRPEPSLSQWQAAARELFDRALYWLGWNSTEQLAYTATVLNLPGGTRVGDRIRLTYKGYVINRAGVTVNWVDVDDLFYVLNIGRTYNADGIVSTTVTVSNLARQFSQDSNLISSLVDNIEESNVNN